MLQNIIVGVVLVGALAYLGYSMRKKMKGGGCGCGCSGCGGGSIKRHDQIEEKPDLPPCCQDKK